MTITAATISFAQIRSLLEEALAAGDPDQAAICDFALDGSIDPDDYTTVSDRMARRLRTMTREEAYQTCADAIDTSRAMESAS